MEEPWTILELAELAADALADAQPSGSSAGAGASGEGGTPTGAGAPTGARTGASGGSGTPSGAARPAAARANGRVRDVPNERLVRWYVTVGLVDPPLSRRGRVARYGRRHLLQLVAVKRLQAEGRSLAEIQTELAGATDEALAAIARVPDTPPVPDVLPVAPARFWTRSAAQRAPAAAEEPAEQNLVAEEPAEQNRVAEEPAEQNRVAEELGGQNPATEPGERDAAAAAGARRALSAAHGDPADRGRGRLVHGVRLAAGVTLLLEGAAREPDPEDVTAILNAARALLAELASRRLREPGPEHLADVPGPPPEVGSRT
jgi:DNA-binding transcriptional MerR regulator